jgi:hypothetical protein
LAPAALVPAAAVCSTAPAGALPQRDPASRALRPPGHTPVWTPAPGTSLTQRRWDVVCVAIAIGLVAYIFWRHALLASRVVDDVRWWWLDDDMMVSMRYGRNLAEGHGLVWNPGERVEGYSNFLWTLVMALVHALGAADRTAALWMRMIAFVLVSGVLIQATRILRVFVPRSHIAVPVMLLATIFCADVMSWAAWGFESSLLTFLLLTFVIAVLHDPRTILGWVALALVPLTRADGVHLFVAGALVGLALSPDRQQGVRRIAFAAIPFVAHVAFRRLYYEEWLPNTYYLKLYLLENAGERGYRYVRDFVLEYPIPLALAAVGALAAARTDRRALLFFALMGGSLAYVCRTGGDMMLNFRFCAHLMPLVFVFAAAGIGHVVQHRAGRLAWAAVLLVASVPLVKPFDRVIAFDGNGDPREQIVVASVINKNALPTSSIAVVAAGIVPYFTHRYAIDILGKSDARIARMPPVPGAMVGHGKLDPDYTLGQKRPDIVVSCRSYTWTNGLSVGPRVADPVRSLLTSNAFISGYRGTPIEEELTLETTAIYTTPTSPEARQRQWQSVRVAPWP